MRLKKLKQNQLKEITIFKNLKNNNLKNKYQHKLQDIKEFQQILIKIQKKIVRNNQIFINDLVFIFLIKYLKITTSN